VRQLVCEFFSHALGSNRAAVSELRLKTKRNSFHEFRVQQGRSESPVTVACASSKDDGRLSGRYAKNSSGVYSSGMVGVQAHYTQNHF